MAETGKNLGRVFGVGLLGLALVAAACSGGDDKGTEASTSIHAVVPVVVGRVPGWTETGSDNLDPVTRGWALSDLAQKTSGAFDSFAKSQEAASPGSDARIRKFLVDLIDTGIDAEGINSEELYDVTCSVPAAKNIHLPDTASQLQLSSDGNFGQLGMLLDIQNGAVTGITHVGRDMNQPPSKELLGPVTDNVSQMIATNSAGSNTAEYVIENAGAGVYYTFGQAVVTGQEVVVTSAICME